MSAEASSEASAEVRPEGVLGASQAEAIVIYSLALSEDEASRRPRLLQMLDSVASLRRQNTALPVLLQLAGQLRAEEAAPLAQALALLDVDFVALGDYGELIDAHLPGAGELLRHYPVLHKLLGLPLSLERQPARRLLYVDNDTYFHRDPALLLKACAEADFYAREEPFSRGSLLGHRPELCDEAMLAGLMGPSPVLPFNTGVMVWNHDLARRLLPLCRDYLAAVIAFSRWLVAAGREPARCPDLGLLAAGALPPAYAAIPPLPYPAASVWIREQIALWLSLSRLPGLRQGWLGPAEVLQGCEELYFPGRFARPVLSHYFSENSAAFLAALRQGGCYRD